MILRPPRSTRTATLFPDTTLVRSERDAARRIALGAPPGTWRKLQEHLLHERRHQRFLDGLEAVLPAPEFDARTVVRQAQPDRGCPPLVSAPPPRALPRPAEHTPQPPSPLPPSPAPPPLHTQPPPP